jgi:phage gp36-like protein
MGNYATTTNLIARIGTQKAAELTSDSGSTPDTTKLEAAITPSEGEMDGNLAPRVFVPVSASTFPEAMPMLREFAIDLAVPRLYLLRTVVPPDIAEQARITREWLARFAKGEVDLPTSSTPTSTASRAPDAEFGYDTRVSTREDMAGL